MKFHTKASPGIVALGSAAVLTVYAAGLVKTRAAAARFDELPAMRRPAPKAPAIVPAEPPVSTSPARAESRRPATAPVARPARTASMSASVHSTAPLHLAPSSPAPLLSAPPRSAPTSPAPPSSAPSSAAPLSPAPSSNAPPADPPAASKALYRDGTYSGWGTSRHGDIEATVVIDGGRITGVYISQCETRYPCSFIAHLPAQVLTRQSADVDYVTGATQSADAFYYAVLEALTKAK